MRKIFHYHKRPINSQHFHQEKKINKKSASHSLEKVGVALNCTRQKPVPELLVRTTIL
jgi:hypothetical protein